MPRLRLVFVALLALVYLSEAMRCRTEDGPSTEQIKKVLRVCMRKSTASNHDHNIANDSADNDDDGNDSDDDYNDSSDSSNDDNEQYEDDRHRSSNRGNNGHSNRNNQHQGNDRRNRSGNQFDNNHNQQQQQANGYGDMNNNPYQQQRSNGAGSGGAAGYDDMWPQSAGGQYQQNVGPQHYPMQNNDHRYIAKSLRRRRRSSQPQWQRQMSNQSDQNSGNSHSHTGRHGVNENSDNGGSSTNSSQNCMVQCFFQELKMTNRDGLPDKHKMLAVMTRDIRDGQLRDFYVDTIHECHRILEQTDDGGHSSRDRCAFSRNLVTCLSERARANCEDFHDSMLF